MATVNEAKKTITAHWIKMSVDLTTNPKIDDLAERLKVPSAVAVSAVLGLYTAAAKYAQDGDITELNHRTIALFARWEKNSAKLFKALCEEGFIDVGDDGTAIVHDWCDYQSNEEEE